ncbi:MAG TPA: molybdopterin converting factor subunit 1 [Rhodocyclaceae bacterium]|nr:molybdopterin converting factor subunit 1 [Rhodocyclaceae bacterium]
MQITVLFFAGLREALGHTAIRLELPPHVGNVGALRDYLIAQGPEWAALGSARNLRAAVNQQMAGFDAPIEADDEIAFFPPVTGG